MKCAMRYFLADIFLFSNLSKGVHFSGQGRRNAGGIKKSMRIYTRKCGERNNRQCEKARKISLFQALKKNSPPKPEGLCCMKVCYIRHNSFIFVDPAGQRYHPVYPCARIFKTVIMRSVSCFIAFEVRIRHILKKLILNNIKSRFFHLSFPLLTTVHNNSL